MAGTLEIPAEGSPNSTEDPKVKAAIKRFNELLNSENKVEDGGLASPNNSAYRTLLTSSAVLVGGEGGGTFALDGGDGFKSAASITLGFPALFFKSSDYEVAGKTQKLRLRAQVGANATKPEVKFTFGLYPLTVAGAENELKFTLGTVVSGSTVELTGTASTIVEGNSGDLTIPAEGTYALGVVLSGAIVTKSRVGLFAQLQTRSV